MKNRKCLLLCNFFFRGQSRPKFGQKPGGSGLPKSLSLPSFSAGKIHKLDKPCHTTTPVIQCCVTRHPHLYSSKTNEMKLVWISFQLSRRQVPLIKPMSVSQATRSICTRVGHITTKGPWRVGGNHWATKGSPRPKSPFSTKWTKVFWEGKTLPT